MNIEKIVLSIISFTFSSLIAYTVYLIFKYLNKKALGMQTLLDEMVKDSIYLMVLMETISMIAIVSKLILGFTSHFLAILLTLLIQLSISLTTWQCNMIFWIRYLIVFHQAFLNNYDESLIKRTTRCTVGLVSIISVLMAMRSIENTMVYIIMTDGDQIPVAYPITNPIVISMIICLITIIGIQFKIEVYKMVVDAKVLRRVNRYSRKIVPMGSETAKDISHSKMYRIEFLMLSFGILITLFLWFMIPGDDMYEKQLRAIVMRQFIQLAIFLICIKRNGNIFLFCKSQLNSQICCRSTKIYAADQNDIPKIHQETNVNENDNDKEDQNENHEDDSDQRGGKIGFIEAQPKNATTDDEKDKIEQLELRTCDRNF